MITLTCYIGTFYKRENSTKTPNSIAVDVQGDIIEPCSIIDPVIKLATLTPFSSIVHTYVKIPDFDNRYYFVTDWKFMDGFWHVYLHLDVLASWKTAIGASTQYVERAHSVQNEYIVDQMFPSTGKMTHRQVQIDEGFSGYPENGWYVLNVTGSVQHEADYNHDNPPPMIPMEGGIGSYLCEWTTFQKVVSEMILLNDDDGFWANLAQGIRNSIARPFDHLGSVLWFPYIYFDPLNSSAIHKLDLGGVTLESTQDKPLTFYPTGPDIWQSSTFNVPKHPQASTYGKYMNLKPFTKYVYQDDIFGQIELDPSMLIDKTTFNVWKMTDPLTGVQLLVLPDGQHRMGQAGVMVPMENNSLNVGGVINSVASAAIGVATANPLAIAQSVGSAAESVFPTVTSSAQQGTAINSHLGIWLDAYFWNSVGHDTNDLGNPYCATAQISTLSGYILCNEAHITAQNMTLTEAQMIESYLNSGFFYE